ncbi:MAG: tetratricopeptide repeat protein, partial [Planctomycetota bacterium]|nr:tetratricopeptide repeat protein [Planctomycetota bacterium]
GNTASPSETAGSATDWFARGCSLLEDGDATGAVEAFRMALMLRPGDAECQFCLADALYRTGNAAAALERYYAVVETDRKYLEAWTQIGCLHAEREELDAAIASFRIALDLHPDYPDAHLHLAEALHASGRDGEAEPHWRQYLEFDRRGPWADLARQRLGRPDEESG